MAELHDDTPQRLDDELCAKVNATRHACPEPTRDRGYMGRRLRAQVPWEEDHPRSESEPRTAQLDRGSSTWQRGSELNSVGRPISIPSSTTNPATSLGCRD